MGQIIDFPSGRKAEAEAYWEGLGEGFRLAKAEYRREAIWLSTIIFLIVAPLAFGAGLFIGYIA